MIYEIFILYTDYI